MTANESRRWYTMPDMIVALSAALISLCTFAVSGYEAWLQRHHDRAEVWPHVELSLVNTPEQSTLSIDNTGIGPAIINSMTVTVDGKPARNWQDVLIAVLGRAPDAFNQSTVVSRALRAGDHVTLIGLRRVDLPTGSMAKQTTSKCPVVAGSQF